MITWIFLVAVIAALAWVALETRRVHQALDHYARAFEAWKTTLEAIEERRHQP